MTSPFASDRSSPAPYNAATLQERGHNSNTIVKRKALCVGDGNSGKTSLLCVFAIGEFPTRYEPTVFDNYVAEIRLDGKPIQLALWDTAGQEEYERLRPLSYASAHVVIIAFSIDTPDSLENAHYKWSEEVRRMVPDVPVLLVGCKSDLRETQQQENKPFVTREQGNEIAQLIGARAYHECSALRNEGVDNVFEAATRASMLVRGNGAKRKSAKGQEKEKLNSARRRRNSKLGDENGCRCVVL